MTNDRKEVVWRAANDAFGRTVLIDKFGGLNIGFPGQYHDKESGLVHNGYRDYVPSTGRYLQTDPSGLAGGINTYGYAGANPVLNIDPEGLQFFHLKNLNRKEEHPMRVPDAFAMNLNVPYYIAAGAAGSYMGVLGGAATGPLISRLALEACSGDVVKQCIVAGTCFFNDEPQWNQDRYVLRIQHESVSPVRNPIYFPRGR